MIMQAKQVVATLEVSDIFWCHTDSKFLSLLYTLQLSFYFKYRHGIKKD